jgi:hypothetical protein
MTVRADSSGRWHRPYHIGAVRLGAAASVAVIAVVLGSLVTLALITSGEMSPALAGLILCVVVFAVVVAVRLPFVGIWVSPDGVLLRRPLRTRRWSWASVRRFRVEPNSSGSFYSVVAVDLTTGEQRRCFGDELTQVPTLMWGGDTAPRMAHNLEAARKRWSAPAGSGPPTD